MEKRNLEKENKRLRAINLVLIIYVVQSIIIQMYNAWGK